MSATQPVANACPCETVTLPQGICNPPYLPSIAYRIGDFVAFRHQLLQPLPGETELTSWRPGAPGDLATQMMEWWAYLADILTFYNERIANESYLRTALLPESLNHLVQILGYRPKPALGAKGTLAALIASGARLPVTLPQGLRIQSKPGPGEQPQVFELDQQTTVQAPDIVTVDVSPANRPLLDGNGTTLWLAGKVSGLKPGDRLLLINAQAVTTQTIADYAWIKVGGIASASDPLGNPVTKVSFAVVSGGIAPNAQASAYVLLRSQQSSPLWGYPNSPPVITATSMELAGTARGITAGSLLLVDVPDGAASFAGIVPTPLIVQSYTEVVWYANGQGATPPAANAANPPTPIAVPHAEIGFANGSLSGPWWPFVASQITVRWGWLPVGDLVPVLTAGDYIYPGGGATLVADPHSANALPANPAPVLLEDPIGNAAAATMTPVALAGGGTAVAATLSNITPPPPPALSLASPIDMFFNLLGVSRGKTVPSEVMGSGNPMVAGQDFTLSQSPVTYFFDTASVSGDNFSSTVEVSVNGVQWQEKQSFYGQPANAQVFVLREDDQGKTHVTFGDGIKGALLPTGTNNVVATYRYGAGAAAPAAETLTVVQTPAPGLKGVRNPLPPTGGSDADSPSQLRSLAPQSVLTFNRAVSLDDYAAIALTAPGVKQAVASFAFDPLAQRPVVTLWISGDAGAAAAVAAALAGTAIPNQGLRINQATPVPAILSLTYVRDPRYGDAAVRSGLATALIDPDTGFLGTRAVGIGQTIYQSQIARVCLAVPGVTAIQNVVLTDLGGIRFRPLRPIQQRRFFPLPPLACSGQSFNPGVGKYFSIPNDGQHLQLTGMTSP